LGSPSEIAAGSLVVGLTKTCRRSPEPALFASRFGARMRGQTAGVAAVEILLVGFYVVLIGGLLFVAPILALIRAHKAARLARENQEGTQGLIQRVYALEKQVEELKRLATVSKLLRMTVGVRVLSF